MSKTKLIVFENKDKKGWYEKWDDRRDLLNFPHPFRCIVSANPGSGKTNMIKNLIIKAKPHFQKIYLCHFDEETKEYDDVDVIKLEGIPDSRAQMFTPKKKSLLIIDDYDFEDLNKQELANLRSLFKYGSTHRGLSIVVASQNFFSIPVIVRRLCNIFFIWKGTCDIDSLTQIGRKIGFKKEDFEELIVLCKSKYDNICIDLTIDSPAAVRFNGYTLIKSGNNYAEDVEDLDKIHKDNLTQNKKKKNNNTDSDGFSD